MARRPADKTSFSAPRALLPFGFRAHIRKEEKQFIIFAAGGCFRADRFVMAVVRIHIDTHTHAHARARQL